ncbi:MAG TPA: DUF1735 domain-containing protein [Sphingobacterium sp.]|nr:DUF1735 domain-containing protein [Sphingobacterium sp.]
MKKYFSIFYSLLVLVLAASCKQEPNIPDVDSYNVVYMAQAKSLQDFVFSQSKGSDKVFVGASYGGLKYAPEDIRIEFDADFSLVAEYNDTYGTNYLPLPLSSMSFTDKVTTIKKGELQSNPLSIDIDFAGLSTFTSYLLPVKVASLSGSSPLKEELSTTYFRIEVRSDPTPVKVMALGKGGTNNDMDKLADIIRGSNSDIVLIREMDKNTTRSGAANDWPAILADKLPGFHYVYVPSILTYQTGQYGMGVYSKYPISNAELHRLALANGNVGPTHEAAPFAMMDLNVNGNTLRLGAVHTGANAANRDAQVESMIQLLGADTGQPFVLVGNMNDNPNTGGTYASLAGLGFTVPCTGCSPNFSVANPATWSDMTLFRPASRFYAVSHTVGTSAQVIGGTHLPIFTTLNVYF